MKTSKLFTLSVEVAEDCDCTYYVVAPNLTKAVLALCKELEGTAFEISSVKAGQEVFIVPETEEN